MMVEFNDVGSMGALLWSRYEVGFGQCVVGSVFNRRGWRCYLYNLQSMQWAHVAWWPHIGHPPDAKFLAVVGKECHGPACKCTQRGAHSVCRVTRFMMSIGYVWPCESARCTEGTEKLLTFGNSFWTISDISPKLIKIIQNTCAGGCHWFSWVVGNLVVWTRLRRMHLLVHESSLRPRISVLNRQLCLQSGPLFSKESLRRYHGPCIHLPLPCCFCLTMSISTFNRSLPLAAGCLCFTREWFSCWLRLHLIKLFVYLYTFFHVICQVCQGFNITSCDHHSVVSCHLQARALELVPGLEALQCQTHSKLIQQKHIIKECWPLDTGPKKVLVMRRPSFDVRIFDVFGEIGM